MEQPQTKTVGDEPTGPRGSRRAWLRAVAWLSAFLIGVVALTLLCRGRVPRNLSADYVCFWAAGNLIASGDSPYDVGKQAAVQRACGWDRSRDGFDLYDFMPFYYPPWFAILCAAFVPLDYDTARAAWLVLNFALLLLSGYLLRDSVAGVPRWIPVVLVPLFCFSVLAVALGQTAPLVLFLLVAAWKLLERRRDHLAGAALAWLTIKPQLTALLLAGVLLWAVRQRRWKVLQGFAATLGGLCLVSTLLVPHWPLELVQATAKTPLPTVFFPGLGVTWLVVLRAEGFAGWELWALYLGAALPSVGAVLYAARGARSELADVLSVSILAAFFVAPYGRAYDFPVLLVPLLVLLGGRLSQAWGAAVLVALFAGPYGYFAYFGVKDIDTEYRLFCIPAALAAACAAARLLPRLRQIRAGAVSGQSG